MRYRPPSAVHGGPAPHSRHGGRRPARTRGERRPPRRPPARGCSCPRAEADRRPVQPRSRTRSAGAHRPTPGCGPARRPPAATAVARRSARPGRPVAASPDWTARSSSPRAIRTRGPSGRRMPLAPHRRQRGRRGRCRAERRERAAVLRAGRSASGRFWQARRAWRLRSGADPDRPRHSTRPGPAPRRPAGSALRCDNRAWSAGLPVCGPGWPANDDDAEPTENPGCTLRCIPCQPRSSPAC